MALDPDGYAGALRKLGAALPGPGAIVVVSAHWEAVGPWRVNAHPRPPLVYDFGGFPDALYRLDYPAPGSPDHAAEVASRLRQAGLQAQLETARGWDHGVWVPLRLAWPAAAVPVVEVSLSIPRRPADLLAVGRALAPLRERGVVILGSGGVVHNLQSLRFADRDHPPEAWAAAFDAWVAGRLAARDDTALAEYRSRAPHAGRAAPTSEHFDPLLVVLGSLAPDEAVETVYEGFHYATLSMRCFRSAAS